MNLDFFTIFKTAAHDGRYLLIEGDQQITCYTERAIKREIRLLEEKLQQIEDLLLWVAPWHYDIYDGLEEELKKQLIWLAPATFEPRPDQMAWVITDAELWQFFLREVKAENNFTIEFHQSLRNSAAFDAMVDFVRLSLQSAAQRLKTIGHFEKAWQYNFRRNQQSWLQLADIASYKGPKPDYLVLGGYSVGPWLKQSANKGTIWCADTALKPVLAAGFKPALVFSIDAGRGSYEHLDINAMAEQSLVVDALSFPLLFTIETSQCFTYASSHPLLQTIDQHFTELENQSGDVKGLMQAAFELLFKNQQQPKIIGADGRNSNGISHVRGSGYYRRSYLLNSRLNNTESYLFGLNAAFG